MFLCILTVHAKSYATPCIDAHDKQMIWQMAIAIALPGFNDLGRLVTPIFLLMDHFIYRFSMLSEKI